MMTRKHYKMIAYAIHDAHDNPATATPASTKRSIVLLLCVKFKEDNPNFNKEKFLEACGVTL